MENLIIAMLNEGIDEDTIINVVEKYLNEGENLINLLGKKGDDVLNKGEYKNQKAFNELQTHLSDKYGSRRFSELVTKDAKKHIENLIDKAESIPDSKDYERNKVSGNTGKKEYFSLRANTNSSNAPDDTEAIKNTENVHSKYIKGKNRNYFLDRQSVKSYGRNKRKLAKQNASESFDNVIELVEGLLGLNEDLESQIIKVHGEPEYDNSAAIKPKNKSAKLLNKIWKIQDTEMNSRVKRKIKELTKKLKKEKKNIDSNDEKQISKSAYFQAGHDGSNFWIGNNHDTRAKNKVGEEKTFCRSCAVTGDSPGIKRRNRKSDTQRMVSSLARNRFKQEGRGKEIDIPAFIRNYKRIMNTDSDNK